MKIFLFFILIRLFLLYSTHWDVWTDVLRGISSDLLVSLLISFLIKNFPNWAKNLIFSLLVIFISANTEHVVTNDANISLYSWSNAFKIDFLAGSGLTPTFLIIAFLGLLYSFFMRNIWWDKDYRLMFLSFFPVLFIPSNEWTRVWVRQNVFEQNVNLFKNSLVLSSKINKRREDHSNILPQDLSGKPLLENQRAQNVLVIAIEGLSGVHTTDKKLFLNKLTKDGFYVRNFINHQRQTNRGLFTLLCGQYPNLFRKMAKADFIISYGWRDKCLPHYLNRAGYKTSYIQSANMTYMRKDLFTKAIEFQESYGNEHIEASSRNTWGLHDEDLYKFTLEQMEKDHKENKKWFKFLLTVSTHHPFRTPDSEDDKNFYDALVYADKSLKSFLEKAYKKGLLDDTLVIITSDEGSNTDKEKNFLMDNWGPFIAIGKGLPKNNNHSTYFGQVDVPLSILDYLNIKAEDLGGRSIFRSYSRPRNIYFGNFYQNFSVRLKYPKEFEICRDTFNCSQYPLEGKFLFDEKFSENKVDTKHSKIMENFFHVSDLSFRDLGINTLFEEKDKLVGDFYHNILRNYKIDSKRGEEFAFEIDVDNTIDKKKGNLFVLLNFYDPNSPFSGNRRYIIRENTKRKIYYTYNSQQDGVLYVNTSVLSYMHGNWKLDSAKLFRVR